jgi:cysteinyl-tRNA synthetase
MLKLHNTYSNAVEEFKPNSDNVKIYLCGPTVQSSPHIGHGRSAVVFDFLIRYLVYLDYEVNFVRNITDIEDKIIERAVEEGITTQELANRVTKEFQDAYLSLNCLPPTTEPKATETIDHIINFIEILIENEYAYATQSGVYFEVSKFKDYLLLSGRNKDEVISGTRVDLESDKKNIEDFALWKISKENEPSWDSPWGNGRPGWHIECSAMINKIFDSGIDIHCGGNDLIFPHHENELAQSSAAFENQEFVKYWLHNGMINLSGQKMSKSEGNIKLLNEYIDKFGGNVIRFFFLRSHYRKPQEFSEGLLEESKTTFKRIQDFTRSVEANASDLSTIESFKNSMNDDLNTPKFLGEIFEKMNNLSNSSEDEEKNLKETIKFIFEILGFNFDIKENVKINHDELSKFFNTFQISYDNLEQAMEEFLAKREKLRSEKDFNQADFMREKLKEIGLLIKDGDDSAWYWENS